MKLKLVLPRQLRRFWIWLNTTPVIEAVAPDDPPELARGLAAIRQASRDNVIAFQKKETDEISGYAFTFKQGGK
jgi:hypothetical protein